MVICYLGSAGSYHTVKWCKYFYEHGHEVHLISFTKGECKYATVHEISTGMNNCYDSDIRKLSYLLHGRKLKRIIKSISPDIIHAHRIPSYGGACALGKIKPFFLSIWGSDIYDFPNKSFFHKLLVLLILKRASVLMSTSEAMSKEIKKYTNKDIYITPFGVDMNLFNPSKRAKRSSKKYVIGNIKSLEKKYGIKYLLEACAIIIKERKDIPIEVRVAGRGSEEKALKAYACDLDIQNRITWLGFISQENVAYEWANMDVAVISSESESESFGVSAVEAQACQIPVVISDIPGLMEATAPGKSSIVVPRMNSKALAEAIIFLYDHPEKRLELGQYGIDYVRKHYEINVCFEKVMDIYEHFINK